MLANIQKTFLNLLVIYIFLSSLSKFYSCLFSSKIGISISILVIGLLFLWQKIWQDFFPFSCIIFVNRETEQSLKPALGHPPPLRTKNFQQSANKFENTRFYILRCFNYKNYLLTINCRFNNQQICICTKSKICFGINKTSTTYFN